MEPVAVLRKGKDVSLLGYGILINELLSAADLLAEQGIQAQVLKLSRIDDIDATAIVSLLPKDVPVYIAEDCAEIGSVGEYLAAHLDGHSVRLLNLGRNGFVRQGSVHQQRESCGLDASSIAKEAAKA